jgi:hypothetical protein
MEVPVTTPGGVRTVTIFLDLTENKSRDFGLTLKTTAGLHYELNVFLLLHASSSSSYYYQCMYKKIRICRNIIKFRIKVAFRLDKCIFIYFEL